MSDVFLSYAREDRDRASELAGALEGIGWSVWWDRKTPPGMSFSDVIQQELDAARCVIVLWSESSVRSEWVEIEASHARSRGVLIPVLIDDVAEAVPLEFTRMQAANLVGWPGDGLHEDFEQLEAAIRRLAPLAGGTRVSGVVRDGRSGQPLDGARISLTLRGRRMATRADTEGRFSWREDATHAGEDLRIVVECPEYESWEGSRTIEDGHLRFEVELIPLAEPAPPVEPRPEPPPARPEPGLPPGYRYWVIGAALLGLWPVLLGSDDPFFVNPMVVAAVIPLLASWRAIRPTHAALLGALPYALNVAGYAVAYGNFGDAWENEGDLLSSSVVLAAASLVVVYGLCRVAARERAIGEGPGGHGRDAARAGAPEGWMDAPFQRPWREPGAAHGAVGIGLAGAYYGGLVGLGAVIFASAGLEAIVLGALLVGFLGAVAGAISRMRKGPSLFAALGGLLAMSAFVLVTGGIEAALVLAAPLGAVAGAIVGRIVVRMAPAG